MSTKTKAYSYLRISTESQKAGDGVRRQMEASEKYAKDHDYELVETIQDLGVSAFKGNNATKGAFAQFLEAIDDGRVLSGSVLIVESLDRISRAGAMTAFSQFASILTKGITIVTLMDGQIYSEASMETNAGQLFMSLGIMMRANEESATKSKRLKAAWQKKRDNIFDLKMTKQVPAWLELSEDRKSFLVSQRSAEAIRTIFDLSINGMGIYSITRHLNGDLKKYPPITNAKRWNDSYISKILTNPAVYGDFQPSIRLEGKQQATGEAVQNYYPVIVKEEIFHLARSRMSDRNIKGVGRKGDGFTNIFTSLVICGSCEGKITLKNKGKPPKGYTYFRCYNSLLNDGCRCPAWRYSEFEASFYNFVKEVNFLEIFSSSGTKNRRENLEALRASELSKQSDLKKRYETLLDRMENPDLSDQILVSFSNRADEASDDLQASKKTIENIDAQISELRAGNFPQDQTDFIKQYDEMEKIEDKKTIRKARFHLHSILMRSIDQIRIHNGHEVAPWEAIDCISDKLGDELYKRGHNTEAKLEDYMSKPHGQRAYDHSERFYTVRFKNGVVRVVHPYQNRTYLSVSERLAEMRSRRIAGV